MESITMCDKNPFGKEWGKDVLKSLNALDEIAEQHAHDKQFTVDGVKLEKGLEVWCVDLPFGDVPWIIYSPEEFRGLWHLDHDGPTGGTISRHAKFCVMYADKTKAINQRIKDLHAEVDKVNEAEIFSRLQEIKELREKKDE